MGLNHPSTAFPVLAFAAAAKGKWSTASSVQRFPNNLDLAAVRCTLVERVEPDPSDGLMNGTEGEVCKAVPRRRK